MKAISSAISSTRGMVVPTVHEPLCSVGRVLRDESRELGVEHGRRRLAGIGGRDIEHASRFDLDEGALGLRREFSVVIEAAPGEDLAAIGPGVAGGGIE